MSCDYQDFEYVFGDGSEFCDEESTAEENSRNVEDCLRGALGNTPTFDEKLQLLNKYFDSHPLPMKFAIDAFITEFERNLNQDPTNEAVQSTLMKILNFMSTQQIQRVLDAGAIDARSPLLLMGALQHVDSEGSQSPLLELVESLLHRGSDPNATVDDVPPLVWLIRNTPESHAKESLEVFRLLLSAGARFAQPGARLDPFREAALKRRQDILELFLGFNADALAEQEALELLWATSLADMRISESATLFEKVLRSRKFCSVENKCKIYEFHSLDDLIKAGAVDQLEAGLDTILRFYGNIVDPSPAEKATVQQVVTKFARAADIRLVSGSEFAAVLVKPLSFGFEFASFKTPKQADLSFKKFANLALRFCHAASFREAAIQVHLSGLLRCTTHQNDIGSQLDELSHPDELGAALCAVMAILRDRQQNELWTPQDSKYEEHLVHSLLKRGAYARHLSWENQSAIDMLTDLPKLSPEIARRAMSSDCCGRSEERVPPLKCQAARSLSIRNVNLDEEELQYRIFVRRSSVASLREFVKAHKKGIKFDET